MNPDEYQALTQSVGLIEFHDRTQVELTGGDRASFLHNLCTNEIRKLPAGGGCEAFLTNVQGKILAHLLVFCGAESLVLETVPGQGPKIVAHLDRYLIREKVTLEDRSPDWAELLLAGPATKELLAGLGVAAPTEYLAHVAVTIADCAVSVRRVEMAGPVGFLLSASRGDCPLVQAALLAAGALPCGQEAAESARIEAGWPNYGQDISEENLPQEVARDAKAISFVKGCYLGQETVARIDALGHVNKTLVQVAFTGPELPPVGTELSSGGKPVGRLTSVAFSPRLGRPLALAYVRRGSNDPGAQLDSAGGQAEVIALPQL